MFFVVLTLLVKAEKFGDKTMRLILMILIINITIMAAPGDLDTTFDSDGKVITPIGTLDDRATAVAIDSNGKIVVAGYSKLFTDVFAVVRYNTDGSLDTSFDTDGKVITDVSTGIDQAFAIAIQSDGKIVVGGRSSDGSDITFGLVRYNTDGSLDTNFGTGGIVITPVVSGNLSIISAITIDSNGKIIAVGDALNTSTSRDFAVVRYNTDGSLDTTFSTDGKVVTSITTSSDNAYAVALDADGKIVVAGRSNNNGDLEYAVVRYNTDGSLDSSFDTDGIVTTSVGGTSDTARALSILSTGKILVGGYSRVGGLNDLSLVRYNTDGSLDSTFGTGGKVTEDTGSNLDDVGTALAIQADGKILLSGYAGFDNFVVARFNADGSVDNSLFKNSLWGTNGFALADFGGTDLNLAMAIDSAGRLVVVGYSDVNGNDDFAVARFENLAPTAASASISGRVSSSGKGRGVSRAIVHLTDQNGNIRTARTNQFGYFRFDDLEVGQTVILNTFHKQYQFDTQVLTLNDSITGLIITPQ